MDNDPIVLAHAALSDVFELRIPTRIVFGSGRLAAMAASCAHSVGGVRQYVVVVSGAPQPARGQGEPQPFTHLSVPNADLYRNLLRTFARAKERFIVHLRPEDVAAELRIERDEQLTQALEQLVVWGNLRADADTSRVTTVEDFHRKRSLYQLTAAGQAAEQAIAFYEEAIGRRGQLQSVALADIADLLRSLQLLAADHDPDPAKVHLLLLSLAERFSSLADNAQAFMSALRRAIDFSDGDIDGFLAYKERLIDYINRFIADLANSGAQIAVLLGDLEAVGHERLLELAARREAADAVPEGADAAESLARAEKRALDAWRNRWRGLDDWFTSRDAGHPSQARLLRQAAVTAIKQLIDAVGLLNERRSGRSDRSADFRVLARWFAEAPDDEAAHRLWRAAFGLCAGPAPVRHQRNRRRVARPSARNGVARRTAHPHLAAAAEDRDLRAARQAQPGPGQVGGSGVPAQAGGTRGGRDRRGPAAPPHRRADAPVRPRRAGPAGVPAVPGSARRRAGGPQAG